MKGLLIVFLLLAGVQHRAKLHPVNITVTDISVKDKKLNMKIKLFTDDFQASMSHILRTPVDLLNVPLSKSEGNIKKYVGDRIQVIADGKPVKWNFKKTWLSNEVTYVEYESGFKSPETIKSLKIKNALLFDDFPEQKNIVNVNLTGDINVLTFDNGSEQVVKELILK